MAIQPQIPGSSNEPRWQDEGEVPQQAFQNVAFAVRSMHETGLPTPMTRDDLRALLVLLRPHVPAIGSYLDGE